MTTLRTAAQQALEALLTYEQYIQPLTNVFGGPRVPEEGSASAKVDAAITALKAALAEPVQEPVAFPEGYEPYELPADYTGPLWIEGQVRRLYESAAPPQRKPEPVALDWLHKWANQDDGEPETQWHEGYEAARRVVQIHLTTPPQRKPLTEEEIEKAYREIWRDLPSDFDHTSSGWIEQGIKYAERAHGIT